MKRHSKQVAFAAVLAASVAATTAAHAQGARPIDKISHVVVLFLENRSFDNLFGTFPGAEGIEQAIAKGQTLQRDASGKPYDKLPPPHKNGPFDVSDNPKEIRELPFGDRPNAPFAIDKMAPEISTAVNTRDLVHRFYTNRTQINGGKNDLFAAYSDAGGLAMGYYSRDAMEKSTLWKLARDNALLDHFFMGAFGGSFLNHIYLVCACAPVWNGAPEAQRSKLDADGRPVPDPKKPGDFEDNRVVAAADGDYAVNTVQSVFLNNGGQGANLLPAQTIPNIGDRLSAKGVDFAWYSGGFDLAARTDRTEEESKYLAGSVRFQWHHQAFAYWKRFDPTTPGGLAERTKHLKDVAKLDADIQAGTLPPVTFYKPSGKLNQHPGYAELDKGDGEVARIADLLAKSPIKDSYALIITYDENGGFFDHVAPPSGPAAGARADFIGPATRVPTLVVSPLVKKGLIDHTEYDTGSILKLITERFDLEPLPSPRVQAVNSLAKVFDAK
ncbi:acid phosphatase [Alsobacter metallidurans]|uniref:Acid phosphatase n=1 Tax=Alsobacter metallidurans TaxID=340221 RepID=A0A917MJL4_9HYPH|nr:acid phosphatase [Alsobacter metallidurans]GGH18514.1 acid phosphatase [Alsobacter metallidurans]